ncbi:MAG: PAS domain-containing protein [Bacteroidales bacterium]|nr:PAS domain-containing protein [Bacteroidales bacterium]
MNATYKHNKLVIDNPEEFYSDLIDSFNGSIHIVKMDDKGNTMPVWMNNQYSKIMGYSFEERQKLGFNYKNDELYHPDDIEIIRNGVKKLFANRGEGHSGMFRVKGSDGKWKWVLSSSTSITIDSDPGYLLCFMVDVNETMRDYYELTEKYIRDIKSLKNEIVLNNLTPTEKIIITELASGKTTQQIAELRNRSYETVNNQKRTIFRKLKIHKISELVNFAVENGLN